MRRIGSIGVIGAGAWGTALALTAARAGLAATLVGRDPAVISAIGNDARNPRYLPGIDLRPAIAASTDVADALAADALIVAVPAQAMAGFVETLRGRTRPGHPILLTAKGIDRRTGKRLSELLVEALPGCNPAVLSGPSFATDVARGLPTAVTLAAPDEVLAAELSQALGSPAFRPYAETDMTGVELGGALKNVLAIAAGIVAGRGLGASASAAVIARGFAEMRRFAVGLGARPETLMGLSGLGDLMLSCSSLQSRNFSHGVALGEGKAAAAGTLVEGVATAAIVARQAAESGIDMPITRTVAAILDNRITIGEAVEDLMMRPLRRETD
jgi:glycerol-3-phosphate dehydrogenase (NAD(P)+)